MRLLRDVLFVFAITVAALAAVQTSSTASQIDAGQAAAFAAACEGLSCNDRSDCGTWCFCNNPTDTTGKCYKDSEAIEAQLNDIR
jgi:hypothetical protein